MADQRSAVPSVRVISFFFRSATHIHPKYRRPVGVLSHRVEEQRSAFLSSPNSTVSLVSGFLVGFTEPFSFDVSARRRDLTRGNEILTRTRPSTGTEPPVADAGVTWFDWHLLDGARFAKFPVIRRGSREKTTGSN